MAVVALFTLGLRVSELVGLDRDDLVVSGGEPVLRVLGKGGIRREVYLTDLAGDALRGYLAEHDARIQHVRADVGHATVATTEHYDRGLRTRAATAADLVAKAIQEA